VKALKCALLGHGPSTDYKQAKFCLLLKHSVWMQLGQSVLLLLVKQLLLLLLRQPQKPQQHQDLKPRRHLQKDHSLQGASQHPQDHRQVLPLQLWWNPQALLTLLLWDLGWPLVRLCLPLEHESMH
jgi:hypothetical protein